MAAGQEADEDAIDHLLLADDDLAYFVAHLIEVAGGELESGVGPHLFILAVGGWQDAWGWGCRPNGLDSVCHAI